MPLLLMLVGQLLMLLAGLVSWWLRSAACCATLTLLLKRCCIFHCMMFEGYKRLALQSDACSSNVRCNPELSMWVRHTITQMLSCLVCIHEA